MEFKYIFAIVVLSIFLLLIFISFAILEYGRIKEEKLHAWILERHSSEEVKNYDLEPDSEEEELPQPKAEATTNEENDTEEESTADVPVEDPYGKIDIEGIEEITGNYNGDK